MKKFLIIRFSSIGDIVLTTPVIRCLKNKYPEAQIHYLTKKSFSSVIVSNPFVNKVYSIEKEVNEIATELKSENYDFVIDLHKNIRSSSEVISLIRLATNGAPTLDFGISKTFQVLQIG